MIFLHNTLGNKKEEFKPIKEGEVRMYNCGPTVYNYVHIGNLRAYVFSDVLRRMFEYNSYKVNQVMNITDIGHLRSDADEGEDKMTAALKREGKALNLESLKELGDFYTKAFLQDLKSLNIEVPTSMPRASEHIRQDVELIKKLEEKGITYTTSDGVYFDISKYKEYGKLGGINLDKEGESRITANMEKKNPNDFAIWKFNDELGWESPWGHGFPGWHIECSAMAMEYLGETFDVHTGGIDHIPIHHNNEIAQSEMATGKPLANYWLHNAFINIQGEKIAKSKGNHIYLKDLTAKGFPAIAYRYLLLGASYRTPMNFNWDSLEGADTALKRLVGNLSILTENVKATGNVNDEYNKKFLSFINDDLDTPKALALVWEIMQDGKISTADKKATIFDFDRVLGLNLKGLIEQMNFTISEEVSSLLQEREQARKNKDFKKSDELRVQILKAGYEIKDTEAGPKLSKI